MPVYNNFSHPYYFQPKRLTAYGHSCGKELRQMQNCRLACKSITWLNESWYPATCLGTYLLRRIRRL